MTITYEEEFSSLMFRWRGSVWKAVLKDVILFYGAYYVILTFQYYLLDEKGKHYFCGWILLCAQGLEYIPLSFLLGFFVAVVVARWWEQFNWISWPDKMMMMLAACLPGKDNLNVRLTLARWSSLQAAIAWSAVSIRTYKRFPTEEHFVKAKLMTDQEYSLYRSVNGVHGKWFLPTIWMINLIKTSYRQKRLDSVQLNALLKEVFSYRDGFAMLYVYDWMKIPLVYAQVVSIATYGYFAICLIARQPKIDELSMAKEATILFPLFTTFQMLFYLGWLKVGQYLMNPFGEDDDDFELNYILDRNTHIAKMIGADIADQIPPIGDFQFDEQIPHTKASFQIPDTIPKSLSVEVSDKDMELVNIEAIESKQQLEDLLDNSQTGKMQAFRKTFHSRYAV